MDQTLTWTVTANGASAPATAANALDTIVKTFEILDAVVADTTSTIDSACPTSNKTAPEDSYKVIVICGKNHGDAAITPTSGASPLDGTFIGTVGTFGSGSVAARSSASKVLASYSSTQVATTVATGLTVISTIGTSGATSPSKSLADYSTTSDTSPPDTTIIDSGSTTDGATTTGSATYYFSSTETGSTFECSMETDDDSYSACFSPKSYSSLAPGTYTFKVKAKDPAGNSDTTPASRDVTVAANQGPTVTFSTANTTTVDEGAAATTYSYSISDPEGNSIASVTTDCGTGGTKSNPTNDNTSGSFKCAWADGPSRPSITATATDSLGATGAEASQAITVRNVVPVVALSGDTSADESATKTYTYTVSDAGGDSTTITEDCGTNATYTDTDTANSFDCTFADGPETSTVSVTADDGDDTGSDSKVVTISNVAPTVTFTGGTQTPSIAITYTYTYSIADPGADNIIGVAVSCGTNGTASNETDTNTGGSFDCTWSAAGSTAVTAQATDSDSDTGNVASRNVTVSDSSTTTPDTAAPETTIASGPSGTINTDSATFTFSASEPATFRCQLEKDGAVADVYTACNDGTKTYGSLSNGNYVFSVEATDSAGNVDATPATRSFNVDVSTAANEAPVATAQSVSIDYDHSQPAPSRVITLAGSDPENASLAFKISSVPVNGTLYEGSDTTGIAITTAALPFGLVGDKVTYVPNTGFAGTDSFDFRANDGSADSAPAAVSISVRKVAIASATEDSTISTETGTGTTDEDPIQTTIVVPQSTGGGQVAIEEKQTTLAAPSGWSFLSVQVDITAPAASVEDPLTISIRLDSSVTSSVSSISDIGVFKTVDGATTQAGACSGSSIAQPDPCVSSRIVDGDDWIITVKTSTASNWNVGVRTESEPAPAPAPAPAPVPPPADETPPSAQAFVTTDRISPNGDGKLDDVTINGSLSEPTDWVLQVRPGFTTANEAVFTASGQQDTSMSVTWDGRTADESIVHDGVYTWELTGSDASGNQMAAVTGSLTVDRSAPVFTEMRVQPKVLRRSRSATATIRFRTFEEFSDPVEIKVKIRKKGRLVRKLAPVMATDGSVTEFLWDLRNKNGWRVNAGRYRIVLVGIDLASNKVKNRAMVVRVKPRR